MKISACIATFNEENNIERCLSSIKNLVDEIIIVDGGSTDRTVEIVKKFKVVLIKTNNPLIFHINKNKAIDEAKGEWILQLDADEVVTRELAREIKSKVTQNNEINGYWIPRLNFFLKRFLTKGGQYPDYTLRFYKNGKGRLPAKDVHEQAIIEGETGYLENPLHHYRDNSFSKYLHGLDRYTEILSVQMKESGTKPGIINFIKYFIFFPVCWFIKSYVRHRGYVDGFAGFVFSFFSSLRFPISYVKLWTLY